MSPRRNRPSRVGRRRDAPEALEPERARRGVDAVETWGHGRWRVRQIPGAAAVKTYRCPGCAQEIRPGMPHLVVWPADDGRGGDAVASRRHWHTPCWRARDRRSPRVGRPRGG